MSTTTPTALEQAIAKAVEATLAAALPTLIASVVAQFAGAEQADQAPTAPSAPVSYRVRTDRQKTAAHKRIAAVNARYDMKLAGGSRKVSDLGLDERLMYDAEVRACWTKPAGKTVTR